MRITEVNPNNKFINVIELAIDVFKKFCINIILMMLLLNYLLSYSSHPHALDQTLFQSTY